MDITKSFGKVWHLRLLNGNGTPWNWKGNHKLINNFITERINQVNIGNEISERKPISAEIPYDAGTVLKTTQHTYTQQTYKVLHVQSATDEIISRTAKWKIKINAEKWQIINFSNEKTY